jgi:transposase InsO family protein
MREISVAEQRYQAVLAVIADGLSVTVAAEKAGVSRQTLHAWLAKYEAGGLEVLADASHRPRRCPHQMPAAVEAAVLELRRVHRFWGPRRIRHELERRRLVPGGALPSESAVYRCLVRAGLIEPLTCKRRAERFKRWERGTPMELWQMDIVGGFLLADGSHAKALTGVDDHSRFCVSARLMPRERTRPVCEGLAAALRRYGVPQQLLTDNGKVFTGRFNHPATEVLFDRICRDNGIEHLLTAPRHPTTTGKIERFHRSMRAEFDTKRVFTSLKVAQQALDEWVEYYNTQRPHQSLNMATPVQRFTAPVAVTEERLRSVHGCAEPPAAAPTRRPADTSALAIDRTGEGWVSRRVGPNGVVCVAWQQVSVGKYRGGENVDVYVDDKLMQIWSGPELLKTVTRTSTGPVRKKNASTPGGRLNS